MIGDAEDEPYDYVALRRRLETADARIEMLEAELFRLTTWLQQNPNACAGDSAGEDLLDIIRSIGKN